MRSSGHRQEIFAELQKRERGESSKRSRKEGRMGKAGRQMAKARSKKARREGTGRQRTLTVPQAILLFYAHMLNFGEHGGALLYCQYQKLCIANGAANTNRRSCTAGPTSTNLHDPNSQPTPAHLLPMLHHAQHQACHSSAVMPSIERWR